MIVCSKGVVSVCSALRAGCYRIVSSIEPATIRIVLTSSRLLRCTISIILCTGSCKVKVHVVMVHVRWRHKSERAEQATLACFNVDLGLSVVGNDVTDKLENVL